MTAIYRIPLVVGSEATTWIEDLDLPLLLAHSGEKRSGIVAWLVPHDVADNYPVLLQWLPSTLRSAIPGHRCSTLGLSFHSGKQVPRSHRRVDLYVGTGPTAARPTVVQEYLAALTMAECSSLQKQMRAEEAYALMLPAFVEGAAKGFGMPADEVKIKETHDALEIAISDKPFFTYRYNTKDIELRRPIFHPLHGPTGKTITQLGEVAGKQAGHFHHTALWIAHQNWSAKGLPNCDNWQMNKNCTKIEHVKFTAIESGPMAARFIEQLHWLDTKGDRVLLTETRTVTVPKRPASGHVIDIDLVLKATDLPVTLNRTPYHLLACRVLDAMLPKNGGAIINSEGKKNPGDGALANWIDISGKLDADEQGVALLNHPKNARQPTPCLQFGGQTIGLSPTHKEALTIDAGKEARFRFRVLVHEGNAETGKVAQEYAAYSKAGQSRIGGPERVDG